MGRTADADLLVGQGAHAQRRGDGQILAVVAVQDGQAAHDLMVAPGQAAQHGKGLALGVGLAHDERIAHHDGVGRDDDVVRHAVRLHGLRLFQADAGDLIGGALKQ